MGRKPVLGLAGLFLASVTLTGCENTDWCCWGKKAPEMPPAPRTQTQTQLPQDRTQQGWYNDPANRAPTNNTTPRVDSTVGQPADPGTNVPQNNFAPRTGSTKGVGSSEETEIIPPPIPPAAGKKSVDDLEMTLPPAKQAPEATRGPKLDPPADQLPVLQDSAPLPSPEAPPPPAPAPEGATKSSSKYQSSADEPPPPPGVPVIKGGGLKGN
jgi:hypothetical protein